MEASDQQGTEQNEGQTEETTPGGTDVQPIEGDQGTPAEQDAPAAGGPGSPDEERRTSAPAPEDQSGVPGLPENEGVEPGEAPGEDRPEGVSDTTPSPAEPTE